MAQECAYALLGMDSECGVRKEAVPRGAQISSGLKVPGLGGPVPHCHVEEFVGGEFVVGELFDTTW